MLTSWKHLLKYSCTICHRILHFPHQGHCGHRYCQSCVTWGLVQHPNLPCPGCEEESEDTTITPKNHQPDYACTRQMRSIQVYCQQHLAGCDWSGRLADLDTHSAECASIPKIGQLGKEHNQFLQLMAQHQLLTEEIVTWESQLSITGRHPPLKSIPTVLKSIQTLSKDDTREKIAKISRELQEQRAYHDYLNSIKVTHVSCAEFHSSFNEVYMRFGWCARSSHTFLECLLNRFHST